MCIMHVCVHVCCVCLLHSTTYRQFNDAVLVPVAVLAALQRSRAAGPRLPTWRSPVTHIRQGAPLTDRREARACAVVDDDWLLLCEHPVEVVLSIAQLHAELSHLFSQSLRFLLAVLATEPTAPGNMSCSAMSIIPVFLYQRFVSNTCTLCC